jgi:hypothetical protein
MPVEREWVGEEQILYYEAERAANADKPADEIFREEVGYYAPVGLRSMAQLALYAQDERTRLAAARDLVRLKLDLDRDGGTKDPLVEMIEKLQGNDA